MPFCIYYMVRLFLFVFQTTKYSFKYDNSKSYYILSRSNKR